MTNQTIADQAAAFFARANELTATRQFANARRELAAILTLTNVTVAHHSLARLDIARSFEMESNSAAARAEYGRVTAMAGVPAHHRDEATRHIAELTRTQNGMPTFDPATTRVRVAAVPRPGAEFHVAVTGNNANPGTRALPFATIERARDAIRALRRQGPLPAGGIAVLIHGGTYPVRSTFQLGPEDSGTATAPIVYRAADPVAPVFTGGSALRGFELVQDQSILSRMAPEARGKVVQINLHTLGLTNLWPLELGGFGSGRGFRTHPVIELFVNGQAMPLARWPNEGFIPITNISTNDGHRIHGLAGSKTGVFEYDSDRPARWKDEKDIRLYGYWFWDWADSYEKVASIDTNRHLITLAPPYHTYGYRKGQKFYALNLLSEIDMPGEWYLDRDSGILYLWPPTDVNQSIIEISAAPFTFVELKNASHVQFQGLTWDLGSADAISVSGGEGCMFAGCTVRRFAGSGISINGGRQHGILSCDVFSLGRGGLSVSGGDRRTLARGDHFVENCHIYELSRIDHTYTPAVRVTGVGQRVAHNLMHHIRSSAINLAGNDHLVELNEAGRVVQESDDQGGVDMYGNPTYRGDAFRWNYFHHIGPWQNARTEPPLGQAGIRLDDAISGVLIYGNIFRHAATGRHGFGGVQIHGGKENVLDNNLFIDCAQAVSFSPWPESHWRDFTKTFAGSKEIDMSLYTNRYAGLANLNGDLNVNYLWRNQFVNCDRVLRNGNAARLLDNREASDATALEALLTQFPVAANAVLLGDIPLSHIGLYSDAWRREVPAALINSLRGDR